jgi:hypothetical protein
MSTKPGEIQRHLREANSRTGDVSAMDFVAKGRSTSNQVQLVGLQCQYQLEATKTVRGARDAQ